MVLLSKKLKNNKIDILIGTQILAKGLDIPTIDLVGVVSADVGLHLPYFRASEKVFTLITQVSGRSGRKNDAGMTIIQTYWPTSPAIIAASDHNYLKFYQLEIIDRKKFLYPPFCHLIRVVSENINRKKAEKEIGEIAEKLNQNKINFIGPGQCFLRKIYNRYRYHIIIKIEKLPNNKITEIFNKNPYITWDVDPIDLL